MKKMKKILCFLLAFVMTFGCMSGVSLAATGVKPADGITWDQPFDAGTGGSSLFRIPCLVSLDDGTIVAGCDARWNGAADGGGLDTIVSRSTNGGKTWKYTFANYLGDNGNAWNGGSTAFIDPAMATDGEIVYMIADLYPAGVALNGATYSPQTGSTGYDSDGNLILAASTDSVNGSSTSALRAAAAFDYHLEKVEGAADDAESYYLLKDVSGNTIEGYTIDAYFNIKGENVNTNLFCGDSPYFPYPTDFLYMTKSADGGATWSVPTLLDLKKASEQSLLVGPGRGTVLSTGRIVFTAYEFTSGDKNSTAIYSDDGGKTWTRGESVSGWSSEATVTEADGKLYMFTRHGNCYYVSADGGATWGNPVVVPKPYNNNCQLSSITYSEKIDGKTAILLSAPSDIGGRRNGKIFVGLVQEDGSISWDYEYKVNDNGAHYAYSCLTELSDGSIGLLYESIDCGITYVNIPIADIANGAKIGTIWLENDESTAVYSVLLAPGASATLNIGGLPAGAEIEVSSANGNAASAVANSNGTITVTAADAVTGFADTAITVKAGGAETVLKVYVTSSQNYKVVELHPGETKTFVDGSGNYKDTADLSVADTAVAVVTVTDRSNEVVVDSEAKAQLGNNANYNGELISVDDCLYTYTSSWTVSATDAGGNTVYLQPYATTNGYPNVSSPVNVALSAGNAENSFYLSGNGGYLHFHRNGNNYYDRVQSVTGFEEACSFLLYKEAADGETGSTEVPGYVMATTVEAGGEYLILAQYNNEYYALYPHVKSGSDSKYTQVAKVTGNVDNTTGKATAQLGTTAAYDGSLIPLSDCLYTFTKSSTLSAAADSTTTVYLNLANSGNIPNRTAPANIDILAGTTSGTFKLKDISASRHLHFYSDTSQLYFDRCGTSCGAGDEFEIYKASESAPENSPIKGYAKVTNASEITDGGEYLIAKKANNENYYILHPSSSTSDKFAHVAKIVVPQPTVETTIKIDAVADGETSVQVGAVTYYIFVENREMDITLKVGDSFQAPGTVSGNVDSELLSTEAVAEMAPYKAVTAIEDGKSYLIGSKSSSYVMINTVSTVTSPKGMGMAQVDYNQGKYSEYLWTVNAADGGGYTLKEVNGQYLTINESDIQLSDTAQTLQISRRSDGAWDVYNGSYYLNNYGNRNNQVSGYGYDANQMWNFYESSSGLKFTGLKPGNTTVTVGSVDYHITVYADPADYTRVDEALASVPEDLSIYTDSSVQALRTAIENVVRGKDSTEQDAVNAMAEAIENAVNALKLKPTKPNDSKDVANKSKLNAAIKDAETKKQSDYTAESWNAFAKALSEAKALAANKNATQADVDANTEALNKAIAGLRANSVSSNVGTVVTAGGTPTGGTPTGGTPTGGTPTGDSADLGLYVGLMAAAVMILGYLKKKHLVTK